ncbi:MAG: GlxA family transcriptional regulator [Kiloniellaceae bacterium]
MFDWSNGETPERIGFLLVPQFSMIGFFSAVEPLRVANRLSGRELYRWRVFSVDGRPVAASNGMTLVADAAIATIERFPTVFVCASFEPQRHESKALLAWLRRLGRQGTRLGGLETGTHILARAGLLDGHRATLHWENAPAFAERFPEVELTHDLFEIDRNRLTCSGGTAPIDLMLHLIETRHGQDLAVSVSEQLLHARIRNPDDHRRMALGRRLGVRHPKLLKIVEAMHENLEEPLGLDRLAAFGGVSRRQLERLFRAHLGDTPTGYYLKLRLRRARQFLEQTDMSVLDVSLACGFASAPYFSRAYRAQFGLAPREDRRSLRSSIARTGCFTTAPCTPVGGH